MALTRHLVEQAGNYLVKLCVEIESRRLGSAGNQAAADFFAATVSSFGFTAECPSFDCIDWLTEGVTLTAGDARFTASASPYSLGCQASAPLAVLSTMEALAAADLSQQIVLLRGDIAKEQLMPKNFPFYNPDHHRQMIALLEAKNPLAIIAATGRDLAMAGGLYPFPLIEDGDFDIPSVYLTDIEGERLAAYAGRLISLESRASRIPATGRNVIARKGMARDGRLVLLAHLDAKPGTPGATDNASGLIVMLLLAELLADYAGRLGIEIAALNGEDYFATPGEPSISIWQPTAAASRKLCSGST
jgi:aminopeptidase YwaD